MNFHTQTDQGEAKMQETDGFCKQPAPQDCMACSGRELDDLLHRRQNPEKTLRMMHHRLAQAHSQPDLPKTVLHNIEQAIGLLEGQHGALEQALDALGKGAATLRQQQRDLLSVPGVGPEHLAATHAP